MKIHVQECNCKYKRLKTFVYFKYLFL
uniref:Uncharacterized protein n=1 Tax=Rhizophora mucronata TaxID=61149 RepID=A0A2P2NKI6_RHIMU